MDLLKLIKDKCDSFSDLEINDGLKGVISQIEIVERHFEKGKMGDDYLFTDVIYRTNQAFEGSLKEAYRVLTGHKSDNLTPYGIEQYFEKNNVTIQILFFSVKPDHTGNNTLIQQLWTQLSEKSIYINIITGILS